MIMNDNDDTDNYDRIPYLENIWYSFDYVSKLEPFRA